jgi:hypothetical protein
MGGFLRLEWVGHESLDCYAKANAWRELAIAQFAKGGRNLEIAFA